jgi:signal transduction histidine kinase
VDPPEGLARTLQAIVRTDDLDTALSILLPEAAAAVGASAAAVRAAAGDYRASFGLTADEIRERVEAGGPGLLRRPLAIRGVNVGELVLVMEDEPTERAADRVGAFADAAAVAMELETLYEAARRAEQARDHFLTAIHHELRTPATALLLEAGALEVGIFGEIPESVEQAIGRIQEHVEDLARVIGSVLDLGRLEADASPLRQDLLDPREMVLDLVRRIEPVARRKGLEVAVYLPRTLPPLQTDPERVGRIVLHLLGNAVKFTESGTVVVRLERSLRQVGERRQPVLNIRVIDTGPGIPEEEIPRLFEPFAQVEEGSRSDSRNRGIGLGLSLSRKLAQSLGGDVALESRPGRGTTATLLLPYVAPDAGSG